MNAAMIGASIPKNASAMPAASTRIVPHEIEHDHAVATFTDREHFDETREIARHQRHVSGF
jgi:hypothetical protein